MAKLAISSRAAGKRIQLDMTEHKITEISKSWSTVITARYEKSTVYAGRGARNTSSEDRKWINWNK
jgi:hypothetical protein